MIILGISDSHESHACILVDGVMVSAIAEERLSRLKTDSSYPKRAIESAISIAGINIEDIDIVAFGGANDLPYLKMLRESAVFSVKDWVSLQEKYWKPKLYEKKDLSEIDRFNLFRNKAEKYLQSDPYLNFIELDPNTSRLERSNAFNKFRANVVNKHLGVDFSKVKFYRHEDCHKVYGYYSSPNRLKKALIFTCEGGGDDSSATVSIFDEHEIKEQWKSNEVNVGRLYAYTTLALGMKPNQHEFKVMGLAPYGNPSHGKEALDFFRTIEKNDGTKIVKASQVPDLYFYILKNLRSERFDNIAWALQEFLEELIETWVVNNIKKYNIDDVIFSGGVGQNIKLMRRLMLNPVINSIWAGPISGDGSLAIGAAWMASTQNDMKNNIEGLNNIYLGKSYNEKEINVEINNQKLNDKFVITANPSCKVVAKWIASGLIIGRFSGRMEFGQRALGNRSIIADPRTMNSVTRINNVIKQRDFWMPFTPSLIEENSESIINNPKNIFSPFMTMAFDIKENMKDKLPAVIHPSDGTIRPQMLKESSNKPYFEIIKEFGNITGLPIILNTSFNLHGEPVVESPKDAISTFLRSDLDILLFDHVAISKKNIL